jgi:excisionase family DNA binding protein
MLQNDLRKTDCKNNVNTENCSVCRELLSNMQQFFDMLNSANNNSNRNWLTVEQVADELKISKSIVYRLIRNGELEAINIVENNGKISKKGHYRINKKHLDKYLENKKVYSLPDKYKTSRRVRQFPNVKNHLGL